jgi:hypothetical protein
MDGKIYHVLPVHIMIGVSHSPPADKVLPVDRHLVESDGKYLIPVSRLVRESLTTPVIITAGAFAGNCA